MALTVTPIYKVRNTFGEFMSIVQIKGDTAYPVGGYGITPSTFTLNAFASTSDALLQTPPAYGLYGILADQAVTGAYCEVDPTNGNLRMYAAGGTEVASAATATAVSALLIGFGH